MFLSCCVPSFSPPPPPPPPPPATHTHTHTHSSEALRVYLQLIKWWGWKTWNESLPPPLPPHTSTPLLSLPIHCTNTHLSKLEGMWMYVYILGIGSHYAYYLHVHTHSHSGPLPPPPGLVRNVPPTLVRTALPMHVSYHLWVLFHGSAGYTSIQADILTLWLVYKPSMYWFYS